MVHLSQGSAWPIVEGCLERAKSLNIPLLTYLRLNKDDWSRFKISKVHLWNVLAHLLSKA